MLSMWNKMKYNGVMVNGTYLKLRYVKKSRKLRTQKQPLFHSIDIHRHTPYEITAFTDD
jgi:hypothetical protein